MTTVYGTSYFVSNRTAAEYYRDYAPNRSLTSAFRVVDIKIREDEIHIGEPPLKDGESLVLLDNNTRYGIRTAA